MQFIRRVYVLALLGLMTSGVSGQAHQQDSLTLVAFYNTLNGPEWDDNSGWLEGPVSSWHGITIEAGRVTEIDLHTNNLTGEFPIEVTQLPELRVLNIRTNNISGSLPPEISNLTLLEELIVTRNNLTGQVPESVSQLTALKELILLLNDFSGPLPNLSTLQNLEALVIGFNDFGEPFPQWILQLPKLNFIDFVNLDMSGSIPMNLFSALPELGIFKMHGNNFEGDVSQWIKDSTGVNDFQISNNNFHGVIPDSVINPEIYIFIISGNEITGIPDFSHVTETKRYFYVENNKLGFHELEKTLGVETFDSARLRLGPQKPLLQADTFVMKIGESIEMTSGSYGTKDLYQWYKDDDPIAGAVDANLTIDNYAAENAGTYSCTISNPDFAFDLERTPVILKSEPVSSTESVTIANLEVYPNPARSSITVHGDGVHTVRIYDSSGKFVLQTGNGSTDISSLPAGVYNIRIYATRGTEAHKLVKY